MNHLKYISGEKSYELSNHLGNVLAVVTDKKVGVESTTISGDLAYYQSDVINYSDYYPFGMLQPNRHGQENGTNYRYNFQGQELDNEIKGKGNSVNCKYRMHDPRLGRFFAVDPLSAKYPYYSSYQFSGNRPIDMVELEGLEPGFSGANKGEVQYAPITTADENGNMDDNNYSWSWNGDSWENTGVAPTAFDFSPLEIHNQAMDRANNPENIRQNKSGLCGMVTCAQTLAMKDPAGYYKFVMDLYTNGTAKYNDYELTAGSHLLSKEGNYYKGSRMAGADWMLLSSMRNQLNSLGYGRFDLTNKVSGITYPEDIAKIIETMGFFITNNSPQLVLVLIWFLPRPRLSLVLVLAVA